MIFYYWTWQISVKIQIFSKNSNASHFFVFEDTGLKFGILTYNQVYFQKTFKCCKICPKSANLKGADLPPPGGRVCKKRAGRNRVKCASGLFLGKEKGKDKIVHHIYYRKAHRAAPNVLQWESNVFAAFNAGVNYAARSAVKCFFQPAGLAAANF